MKQAVFGLNGDSANGPYGFTSQFYHSCWEIIGGDVLEMVKSFFFVDPNGQSS